MWLMWLVAVALVDWLQRELSVAFLGMIFRPITVQFQ